MNPSYLFRIFFIVLIFLFAYEAESQVRLNGVVYNDHQEPLAYANIVLYSASDSLFVGGSVSDESGVFEITSVALGTYFCKVSMVGYSQFNTEIFEINGNSKNYALGNMVLKENDMLDEVVIEAEKPLIVVEPDKIVFNVESSPTASGSNGLELLSQAPGVTVDMDNSIQLLGKGGARIFLNGRPSRLSGGDLVNLLQSMTADNIESIEVISNPSAKYEASGNAGIININLKKNINTGFNGNLSSSISKGVYTRLNNSLALNHGGEKVRASLGINYSDQNRMERFQDVRDQNGFSMDTDSDALNNSESYNIRGDIEFNLGEKHILNFSGNLIFNESDNYVSTLTNISENNLTSEILLAESQLNGNSINNNININYEFSINESSEITAEFSLGGFETSGTTDQPNTYFGSDGSTFVSESNLLFDTDTYIDLLSARLDYEKKWDNFTLSTGGKYVSITTDNDFTFYSVINNDVSKDLDRSNQFRYTEDVIAIYGIGKIKMSDRVTANLGLRMEHTESRGLLLSNQDIENTDVRRSYTNYFPNIGVSFNANKDHALNASVGRRISRPNYQNLNPFERPESELSIWKGNPFLNPNYTMNYQLTYSLKRRFVITNQYSETTDFFANLIEINGEKGTIIIPRNMDRITNLATSINYSFSITDFWDVMTMVTGSYKTYNGDIEGIQIDLTNINWNARIQNSFNLPWDMNLELSYFWGSAWVWRGSVLIEGNSNLRFGLRKEFFNDRLQINITGSDILRTGSDYYYYGDYGGMIIDGVRIFDNRRLGISALWKFGNQKAKTLKKKKGGLSDELKRL